MLFVFILSPRRVAAQLAWVSQALPSPTPTPTASYALPYPIHAPWPAGAALYAGKDGSYFWDCDPPAKFHCDEDQLALDFNGEGDKDKGMVVLAVADGRVVEKGKQFTGYGYYLVIGHQGGIQSRYAHLEGESKLKEGDFVTQGTPLGKIGASGLENPDHHHLHFALYYCDPKDIVSNQSGIERCLNYQAVYPLPLSSYEVLTEGHPIISENFPVGYEAISNFYEDSQWKNHLAFVETYRLIGGQKALGLTSSPLKPWPNTTYWYQEFNPTAKTVSEYDPSSQKRAALFGDDRQVFYIHEEIWAEYKRKGGPRSSLGPPVFHSYSYRRSSDPQRNIEEVRGDFVHGSIIFIKGGGTIILEEKDADWKGRFYEDPSFKQLKFRRFDQYIDFSWEPKPQSNPLNSMGSAAIWVGKLGGLINAYHIDATIQGHLQILVNGKEKLKIDSPDRMTSGRSLQIGLFEDTIEIRFWQEWDKKARIHITSKDLLSIVGAVRAFESEGEIQYDLVPPPEYDFAAFEPPPFPGVVSPSSPPPSVSLARTATVLVVDVSGSMGGTWMGGVKIDSAKSAAEQLINMIEQDSLFEGAAHRAGLVSFTDYAERNSDLTSNFEQIRQQISSLYPFSMTNIGAGLETANEILASAAVDESKIIILLSDGMTNVGLTAQEILAGPVEEARRQGTCIYTVGFGDPGNLDENLLRQIAEHSGCGEYFYATDVNELE
ncbi:MAG: VWA domain-containing protein, partial [Candidatus Methanosuratincola sp.]